MILEKIEQLKVRSVVTRICDECGGHAKALWGTLKLARNKRGNDKDYCKKCCYKYRVLKHETMERSSSWNGGRYLNENGYYRVYTGNLKYEYEHKVKLSEHLGRKLLPHEKVHFIDQDKANTAIENLYLCSDKASHWQCHQSMEVCAFALLGSYVWYNYESKLYTTLSPIPTREFITDVEDLFHLRCYLENRRVTSGYYKRVAGTKKFLHVLIAERILGRTLLPNETVHHINGDTLNNAPSNITVMTRSEHKTCHYSLQDCVSYLYKAGIISFENGKYVIKEIIP